MQPVIVIPPKLMSADDIKRLRDNGLCVVEAADPAKLRFLDPLPSVSQRTHMDDTAIKLSRVLLNSNFNTGLVRSDFTRMFVDLLLKGTSLDSQGTQQEQEQKLFDQAKTNELYRLAREEARAERAARKEAEKKEKKAS